MKIVPSFFHFIAAVSLCLPSSYSSSSFTNSFLAESSTVSERSDRLPNGGRAVRRHDDGDESEWRRCCGHFVHAARTFGAFVRRRWRTRKWGREERKRRYARRGEKNKRRRKIGEKERERERETQRRGDQRRGQPITYIQQCSRHMHAWPLDSYHNTKRTYVFLRVRVRASVMYVV